MGKQRYKLSEVLNTNDIARKIDTIKKTKDEVKDALTTAGIDLTNDDDKNKSPYTRINETMLHIIADDIADSLLKN